MIDNSVPSRSKGDNNGHTDISAALSVDLRGFGDQLHEVVCDSRPYQLSRHLEQYIHRADVPP